MSPSVRGRSAATVADRGSRRSAGVAFMIWAWLFVALLAALAIVQIAVAAGAPLGRFTWEARTRVLPAGLRVAAVVSILIYAVMAALALDRAGAVALLVAVG